MEIVQKLPILRLTQSLKDIQTKLSIERSMKRKERFKAEYYQLCVRLKKLENFVENYKNLDFAPSCSKEILEGQANAMKIYKMFLERRAEIENVTFDEV